MLHNDLFKYLPPLVEAFQANRAEPIPRWGYPDPQRVEYLLVELVAEYCGFHCEEISKGDLLEEGASWQIVKDYWDKNYQNVLKSFVQTAHEVKEGQELLRRLETPIDEANADPLLFGAQRQQFHAVQS